MPVSKTSWSRTEKSSWASLRTSRARAACRCSSRCRRSRCSSAPWLALALCRRWSARWSPSSSESAGLRTRTRSCVRRSAAALRDPDAQPELFRQLANRRELQLVLMTRAEAAKLTHAQMTTWGTNGLQPHELGTACCGRPAQQFKDLSSRCTTCRRPAGRLSKPGSATAGYYPPGSVD